jgi:hypothetical protein
MARLMRKIVMRNAHAGDWNRFYRHSEPRLLRSPEEERNRFLNFQFELG